MRDRNDQDVAFCNLGDSLAQNLPFSFRAHNCWLSKEEEDTSKRFCRMCRRSCREVLNRMPLASRKHRKG